MDEVKTYDREEGVDVMAFLTDRKVQNIMMMICLIIMMAFAGYGLYKHGYQTACKEMGGVLNQDKKCFIQEVMVDGFKLTDEGLVKAEQADFGR